MSKGSQRRPQQVSEQVMTDNYARIQASAGYCIHGKKMTEPCKFCKPPVEDNPYRKHWDAAS